MVEIFRENMKSARYFNQPRQYWVSVEKDQSSRRPMPFSNCFVLIQTARVTNQIWSQTKDQVAATLEDPKNKKGQNIPLWMRGHAYAFSYYGLYTSRKVTLRGPTGLNLPDNVVSVILPSGVSKLKTYPKEVTYLKDLLGIRLRDRANPLVASDYAYTTVGEIKREIDRPDRPKPGYILFNVTSQEPDGSPTSTITLSCDLL